VDPCTLRVASRLLLPVGAGGQARLRLSGPLVQPCSQGGVKVGTGSGSAKCSEPATGSVTSTYCAPRRRPKVVSSVTSTSQLKTQRMTVLIICGDVRTEVEALL
jgi:hypothetical protein